MKEQVRRRGKERLTETISMRVTREELVLIERRSKKLKKKRSELLRVLLVSALEAAAQ